MSLVVRHATIDDYAAYLPMARNFLASTPMGEMIPFDEEAFKVFYANAMNNPDLGAWIAEYDGKAIGGAGALAFPMYFNPAYVSVQEIWWWLEPEARGKGAGKAMYRELEKWAAEKGAKALIMVALENGKIHKFESLYARQGFKPMERTFFREVA
jgi:RimJ/RimL family protein N-acetyltransferase